MSPEAISSGERHLSIGEVLAQLHDEFPDVTISKIRFLESQGLIDPERTPSGYRKFYSPDLDRLRWILFQQREHFLPLRVIKERLDSYGGVGAPVASANGHTAGELASEESLGPRPRSEPMRTSTPMLPFDDFVDDAEEAAERLGPVTRPDDAATEGMSRAELVAAVGLARGQLESLEDYGIVVAVDGEGTQARYDEEALDIASIAKAFHARGIEARHLRMYRHLAEREAALLSQVLLRYVRQRNPEARARLQEELEELTRLGRRLRNAMLRQALRDELAE